MSPLQSATKFYENAGAFFIRNINSIIMSLLVIILLTVFLSLKNIEKDKTIVYLDQSFSYSKRPLNMHTAINEINNRFNFKTPTFDMPNLAFDDIDWFNNARLSLSSAIHSNKPSFNDNRYPSEIEIEVNSNTGHVGKKRYLPA